MKKFAFSVLLLLLAACAATQYRYFDGKQFTLFQAKEAFSDKKVKEGIFYYGIKNGPALIIGYQTDQTVPQFFQAEQAKLDKIGCALKLETFRDTVYHFCKVEKKPANSYGYMLMVLQEQDGRLYSKTYYSLEELPREQRQKLVLEMKGFNP